MGHRQGLNPGSVFLEAQDAANRVHRGPQSLYGSSDPEQRKHAPPRSFHKYLLSRDVSDSLWDSVVSRLTGLWSDKFPQGFPGRGAHGEQKFTGGLGSGHAGVRGWAEGTACAEAGPAAGVLALTSSWQASPNTEQLDRMMQQPSQSAPHFWTRGFLGFSTKPLLEL